MALFASVCLHQGHQWSADIKANSALQLGAGSMQKPGMSVFMGQGLRRLSLKVVGQ